MATVKLTATVRRDIETYRALLQDERQAWAQHRLGSPECYLHMDRVERAGWVVAALQAYLAELERTS